MSVARRLRAFGAGALRQARHRPDGCALSHAAHRVQRVTAGLRGMNPALYGGIDLIALVADGQVRQVLQPRSLPWER